MLPLLPIAEGYPAVQCQFPRRRARHSPSPTPTFLANSITAHQRLAHCSAKVLPIAVSTARGQLWMKTTSARPHPVKWLETPCAHAYKTAHNTHITQRHISEQDHESSRLMYAFIKELCWLTVCNLNNHMHWISNAPYLFSKEKKQFLIVVFFPSLIQCTVAHPQQIHPLLPTKNHEWKKRCLRVQHTGEIYKEVSAFQFGFS